MGSFPHDYCSHIVLDDQGVAWIDGSNIKVIEVAIDYLANRSSAEEMHRQHPNLSVAQIHAALAYYYDHQSDFDAQIERSFEEYKALHTQSANSPVRNKLRALGRLK